MVHKTIHIQFYFKEEDDPFGLLERAKETRYVDVGLIKTVFRGESKGHLF